MGNIYHHPLCVKRYKSAFIPFIPLKIAFAVKKFHLALVLDYGIMFNCGFNCEKSVGFVEVNRDGRFENIS